MKTFLQYALVICFLISPFVASASIKSTLHIGSSGNEVTELQSILSEQGLLTIISGYFGTLTYAAVQSFQAQHSLPAIGTVGPLTRAALSSRSRGPTIITSTSSTLLSTSSTTRMGNYIELVTPDGYVNTNGVPITLAQYIGKKAILVNFLTYSCINCQRTVPYLNKWYSDYKDKGLMVVAIQTPEFASEKNITNVETEFHKQGVQFPIVLDNEYQTWNAYKNQFWPHRYLIDLHGNVVYDHIGEGDYDGTEAQIKKALGL
jgi:thiol-disulfide isomerase/thioredoxin